VWNWEEAALLEEEAVGLRMEAAAAAAG